MSLPKHLFENLSGEQQVASESNVQYLVEKVEYQNGIQTFIKGAEYPQKGMAQAETIFFVNISKRILAEGLKLACTPSILFGLVIYHITDKHSISKGIDLYNSILWKIISPYILKKEYMTGHAREMRSFTYNFLKEIGIHEYQAYQFSSIFSHFLEYDNAYRYRLQDLLSETTKEKLYHSPIKEIKRLVALNKKRDSECVSSKIKAGGILLSLLLCIPKYRNAFKESLINLEFKDLQFDEVDLYWISMRTDYVYLGEEVEVRAKRNKGKSMPIPMPQAEFDEYMKNTQKENNELLILKSIDVLLESEYYKKIIKEKLK